MFKTLQTVSNTSAAEVTKVRICSRNVLPGLAMLALTLIFCQAASAQYSRFTSDKPLAGDFDAADVIVVAKITSMPPLWIDPASTDQDLLYKPFVINCQVARILKGSLDTATIQVNYPITSPRMFAGIDPNGQTGSYALFMLQRIGGSFHSTGTSFLFIPLGKSAPNIDNLDGANSTDAALEVILSAAKDKAMRRYLIEILTTDDNPAIPVGLFPYLHDPDPTVRTAVLRCMASCHQVAAIPLISAEIELNPNQAESQQLAWWMRQYSNVDDASELWPLTMNRCGLVRESAMHCLFNISSPGSIPFFILELLDPDEKGVVRDMAYSSLYGLVPEAKAPANPTHAQLYSGSTTYFNFFSTWWSEQLQSQSAITGSAGKLLAIQASIGDSLPAVAGIFSSDPNVRESECMALLHAGADTQIGYLVLCLSDPDNNVSYPAYRYLRTFAARDSVSKKMLGSIPDMAGYNREPDVYNQAIYQWWQDWLASGNTSTPAPSSS
jgi:hypothetical protein